MLITTIQQFRTASSINISNTIDPWLPYIQDAEETFIIPVIGIDMYYAILAIIEDNIKPIEDPTFEADPGIKPGPGSGLTAEELQLSFIDKLRNAEALYALYLGIDEMSLSISSAGIQVIASDTHKPAPQYQIMNLKETYITRAHRQIDVALAFFMENEEAIEMDPLVPSPYFIRNAAEFQLQADIHSSRRVFLSLLPIIASVEKKYIIPTLSLVFFNDLKDKFQNSDLNDDEQLIIDMITPALAHLTMARALLEISIDVLDWGIFNNASNSFNSIATKTQVNSERIARMVDANQRDGEAELKMLQEFLDNNASASKYALYYNSSRFVGAESSGKRGEFINDPANSIFVV